MSNAPELPKVIRHVFLFEFSKLHCLSGMTSGLFTSRQLANIFDKSHANC